MADKKKNDGYFALVEESAQKARERGYPLNQNNVTGLGTIYSWDFAFVAKKSIQESPVSRGEADTMYFRYIGQAAQVNTTKRIREHVKDAKSGSNKADRKMYAALGTALKDDYRKQNKFPETSTISTADNNNIVKVVHVASLFDLAALEAYMINQDKLTQPEFNSFDDIIQKRGLIGLNTLASGVNAAIAGAKQPGEIIASAFFYLTEDDPMIVNQARKDDEKLKTLDDKLVKYGSNYIEATKEIFRHFNIDKKYQIDSPGFNNILNNFYNKLASDFQTGLQLDNQQMVDITKKFGNPELKIYFSYVDLDEQIIKGIVFKMAMSEKKITESTIKRIGEKAGEIYRENISKNAMTIKLAKLYMVEAKKLASKKKIIQKIKKPNLDVIGETIVNEIQENIDKKITRDMDLIFSERAFKQQKRQEKAGNIDYISADDIILLAQLISSYSIEFFKIMGTLPTTNDIAGIIGFFAASNKKNILKTLLQSKIEPATANKLVNNLVVNSEWTT